MKHSLVPISRLNRFVQIANVILFPVALLGFVAMFAFFYMRIVLGRLILSPWVDRVALTVIRVVPPEMAHKMAIAFLKLIRPFLK